MQRKDFISWKCSSPIVDAVTDSAGLSEWEKAELTVSDRPDLASAKVVISGGMSYHHITFLVCTRGWAAELAVGLWRMVFTSARFEPTTCLTSWIRSAAP